MSVESEVLDAIGAAKFIGAHVETVRRLARKGELPAFKVGKDWRFKRSALDRWSDEHPLKREEARVLVIDDDAGVREAISRMIKHVGCRAVAVESGHAGLAVFRTERVDLILLDLVMPEMDGVQFLAGLRQMDEEVPVIIVTGYPDSDLMAQANTYGPIMLLAKPVAQEKLNRAVRLALHGSLRPPRLQ